MGEYYGFQDHDNDKHSSIRPRTTSNCILDPLEINSTSKEGRSRNNSGASTTKKRIRANSSSSNHGYGEFFTTKKLRVEVTKLEELTDHSVDAFSSADETCPNSESRTRKKLRTTRSKVAESAVSPPERKRSYRSELDKLLEAGLSSFHCETARQAADRLGPLKVDVSDNSSESGSTNSAEQSN